ncbi:MAG: type I methionyl aminopeptidase [Clostridia bacterium]
MNVTIKSPLEIDKMKVAGGIVRDTLLLAEEKIRIGMSTKFLNNIIHDFIIRCGAEPSFLNYNGYPASACISVDDVVVHGIPSDDIIIQEGMIVSVDVGAVKNGYHGDAARTFLIGNVSPEKEKLVTVTRECFFEAFKILKEGATIGDIGNAVYQHATINGYGVVREMIGHGIGAHMHEPPDVPNYGIKGHGLKLLSGMTIAIEPMINLGTHKILFNKNGWAVSTADGKPSAHYENTVVITKEGAEILTL